MSGERENTRRCPLCGGKLERGAATVPFLLPHAIVLVKNAVG
jgi:hypothetical protein